MTNRPSSSLTPSQIVQHFEQLDGPATIARVRSLTGYTQARLRDISGLNTTTLAKIAAGDVTPTRAQRAALLWAVAVACG